MKYISFVSNELLLLLLFTQIVKARVVLELLTKMTGTHNIFDWNKSTTSRITNIIINHHSKNKQINIQVTGRQCWKENSMLK